MRRVLVIGSPGAGQSTLSHALARRAGLPLHHLDRMFWLPGWVERDRDEGRAELANVLAQDCWIIDGNYGSTLPLRIACADTVVWLDYPTALCLGRALRRWWMYRGHSRPDMTEGCPERFDLEFLVYLMRWNSGPRIRTEARLKGHENKIVRLRGPGELRRWMDLLSTVA